MNRPNNGSLRNTSVDSKRRDFGNFAKPCKRTCQKGKIEFIKHSKERGQLKLICGKEQDARQSQKLGKVDGSKDCPMARLEFVKPIRNGVKKSKNLIVSRPTRAETGLEGRKNGFKTQEKN